MSDLCWDDVQPGDIITWTIKRTDIREKTKEIEMACSYIVEITDDERFLINDFVSNIPENEENNYRISIDDLNNGLCSGNYEFEYELLKIVQIKKELISEYPEFFI